MFDRSRNGFANLSVFAAALFLAGFLATVPLARAQTAFGSIVGTVTDASGASIPGAAVTLTNIGTAERKTATSSGGGDYQFVNLIPGNYRLEVENRGFKRYSRGPIRVDVESAVRIDAEMQLGDVAEVLTVSGQTPLLQTQTASIGNLVEGRVVEDMPLNGRNPFNLVELAPGVIPQGSTSGAPLGNQAGGTYTNDTGWGNYQIGGGMANQSAFYLDGVPLNTVNANSPGIVPVQDAIQEFRVDTNAISAEFGRYSGGVVNMATKSGTNEFHGTAYEYLRNKLLNANNFFNNRSGVARNAFTQNQYGAAGGGPVVKDKFFFFVSWENFGLRNGLPTLTTVPTAAMEAGNFSGLPAIYDPYTTCGLTGLQACPSGQPTRVPFPNNTIPSSRFDPTAVMLAQEWGAQNLPGNVNNFAGNTDLGGNQTQEGLRGDYNLGNQRLFGRYTYWNGHSLPSDPFHKDFGGLTSLFAADDAVLGDTWSVNPTTVLDFRISYLRAPFAFRPEQTGVNLAQYGPAWAALTSQVTLPEAPLASVTGFAGFSGVFIQSDSNEYFLSASGTKTMGRHTFKFGGEARRWDWAFVQSNTAAGSFAFNNVFTSSNPLAPGSTGYAFASYMLGTPSSGSLAGAARVMQQIYYQGYYATDTYRLTNKLTLNLGVRLDVDGSFSERYNRTVVWQPGATDPLGQQVGMNLKGQMAFVDSPAYPDRHQLGPSKVLPAPRIGIAWSPVANTAVRIGYGLSWVSPEQINYSLPPFQSAINAATTTMVTSVNGSGLVPLNTLSNPFPTGLIEPLNNNPAGLTRFEGQSFNAPIPNTPFVNVQQWNLSVQHQFGGDLSIDAGYAGSKATHLAFSVLQMNQLPDKDLALGSALLNSVPNPFYGALPASAGTLGLATVTQEQLLRPFPQFLNLGNSAPDTGDSTYHALQAKVVKRLHAGGTVTAAYTWSKLLSDTDTLSSWLEAGKGVGGVQDPSNLRLEKSLASFDAPQRLVISYVVDLPVGKGRKLLGNVHGVGGKLVSGWGIAGISTFQTGLPLAFSTASNLTNSLGGGSRPNVVSSNTGMSGSAVSRINEWFNTAAFAQPPSFTFGNESRTDPHLKDEGIANFDFTVVKNTQINERVKLEFHTEFFNLFNRIQFADPNASLGNPSFGIVTSTQNQARLVQLGLRLSF